MVIALRATTFTSGSSTAVNHSLTIPAATQIGDLMVLNCVQPRNTGFTNDTTGWTQIGTNIIKGTALNASVWVKVAVSGDPGRTWQVSTQTDSVAVRAAFQLAVYSGVDTTTPVINSGQYTEVTSGVNHPLPSITTTAAANAIIGIAMDRGTVNATANWTVPSPFTEAVEGQPGSTGSASGVIAHSIAAVASGATIGGQNFTSTFATANAATFIFTLKESTGGGPPPGSSGTVDFMIAGAPIQTAFKVTAKTANTTALRLAVSTSNTMTSPTYYTPTSTSGAYAYFEPTGLTAGTRYYYQIEDTPSGGTATLIDGIGTIKTLKTAGVPQNFTVAFGSCSVTDAADGAALDNYRTWGADLNLHLGDLHYKSLTSTSASAHVTGYEQQIANASGMKNFVRDAFGYYCTSDHEAGGDNADSGTFTQASIDGYKQIIPHRILDTSPTTKGRWQKWRVGRVGFFMVDIRNMERSSGSATDNSSKTMLGATQMAAFQAWLLDGQDALKVIVSDVPWMGAANIVDKPDAWWSYTNERQTIINLINNNNINVDFWHGDTHAIGVATKSKNIYGGFPVLCAAPFNNTGGGRNLSTFSAYYNNAGGDARQYMRVTFTDDGTTITRVASGWDATSNTQKVTQTDTWVVNNDFVRIWTGSSWSQFRVWNGTSWELPKVWNGTRWVQD